MPDGAGETFLDRSNIAESYANPYVHMLIIYLLCIIMYNIYIYMCVCVCVQQKLVYLSFRKTPQTNQLKESGGKHIICTSDIHH